MQTPCKANLSEASSRLTQAARGERKVSVLDKRKWLPSEVGRQTSSLKPPPPPPSQTGLHHLSQCCQGCLDQGLSYPDQLSYTPPPPPPPLKILERYWLEGRLQARIWGCTFYQIWADIYIKTTTTKCHGRQLFAIACLTRVEPARKVEFQTSTLDPFLSLNMAEAFFCLIRVFLSFSCCLKLSFGEEIKNGVLQYFYFFYF